MTASFLDRLKAEIDKLEQAQTKLEQGEIMDFEEIKGRVAALCEDITNSPPSQDVQEFEETLNKMGDLITILDSLTQQLKDIQAIVNATDEFPE
jgi:hypothetical protein